MKHPIWLALGAGALVLLAALVMPLWHMWRAPGPAAALPASAAEQGLPWQVQALGEGRSRVFGLVLGQSRLADAETRFGDALQLGLVARAGEIGVLEALVDPMAAGFVSGRLVIGFDVPATVLERWRSRPADHAPMAGGVRRFSLTAQDRDEARTMPIASLTFVPAVRLSEDDVRQRFGAPDQVHGLADQAKVLLYPERGLAVTVQAGSRGLLQYVAPAQFEARLRAPLLATPAAARSAP